LRFIHLFFAAALFCVSLSARAQTIFQGTQAADFMISAEMVRYIENMVAMPERATALHTYDRFYVAAKLEGRDVIIGIFLKPPRQYCRDAAAAVPGIQDAYTLPYESISFISDGACGIVSIYFDLKTNRLIRLQPEGRESALAVCNSGRGS